MKKKKAVPYTVEREYLSRFSVDELLIRIIRSHLKEDKKKDGAET